MTHCYKAIFICLLIFFLIMTKKIPYPNHSWSYWTRGGGIGQAVENAIFLSKLFKPLDSAVLKAVWPWTEPVNPCFCLSKFELYFCHLKTKNSWLIQGGITVLQIHKLKIEFFRNDQTQRSWFILTKFKRDWRIIQNTNLMDFSKSKIFRFSYLKYSHLLPRALTSQN